MDSQRALRKMARLSLFQEEQGTWTPNALVDLCQGDRNVAVFLNQVLFRWKQNGCKPFYKFASPCRHKLYRPGDSWTEELRMSRFEFERARGKVSTKFTSELAQEQTKAETFAETFVIFWTDASHVTWYDVNFALLEREAIKKQQAELEQEDALENGEREPDLDGALENDEVPGDKDVETHTEIANASFSHQETAVADASFSHQSNASFSQQTDASFSHYLISENTEKNKDNRESENPTLSPQAEIQGPRFVSARDLDENGLVPLGEVGGPLPGKGSSVPKKVPAKTAGARSRAGTLRSGSGKPAKKKDRIGALVKEGSPKWPMVCALAEVVQIGVEDNRGFLDKQAKSFLDRGYTPEQIKAWYGDPKGWWYTHDWRGRRGEAPNIASINRTIYQAKNNIDPAKGKKVAAAHAAEQNPVSEENRAAKELAERAKGIEQIVANNPQVYGPKLFAQEKSRSIVLEIFNRRPDLFEKACAASPTLREIVRKANGGKLPAAKPRQQLQATEE